MQAFKLLAGHLDGDPVDATILMSELLSSHPFTCTTVEKRMHYLLDSWLADHALSKQEQEMKIEDFWKYVDKTAENGCWLWTHVKNAGGYGRVSISPGTKRYLTHRLSYALTTGKPIPEGLCVLHHCDNPPCVNPAHLFLGTHLDNSRDKIAKGRDRVGDQHPSHLRPECLQRGEHHWSRRMPKAVRRGEEIQNARLTENSVRLIRKLYREGCIHRDIASRFAVTRRTIGRILDGTSWDHVK